MNRQNIGIIDAIVNVTDGIRYNSHKHQNVENEFIYEDEREVEWKSRGETLNYARPIDLGKHARELQKNSIPSIFSYFLDGTRKTYKIEDLAYKNNIYPIVSGQVVVGCLHRVNKSMKSERCIYKNVVVLPEKSMSDDSEKIFINDVMEALKNRKKSKIHIEVDDVLIYKVNEDEKAEKKAVSKIQDYMVHEEKVLVKELVDNNKLDQDNWLIKDGTLEYSDNKRLKFKDIKNNYKYVIGVSKSFNPNKCKNKAGKSNSDFVANLKLYERTPAYMFTNTRGSNVNMVVWYVRIRDKSRTNNIFDGILKVEKIILREAEIENGLDSEQIDNITAHLINERNPVCYGQDMRWANHIYPIFLTESYIKSRYLSNDLYLQLF